MQNVDCMHNMCIIALSAIITPKKMRNIKLIEHVKVYFHLWEGYALDSD